MSNLKEQVKLIIEELENLNEENVMNYLNENVIEIENNNLILMLGGPTIELNLEDAEIVATHQKEVLKIKVRDEIANLLRKAVKNL